MNDGQSPVAAKRRVHVVTLFLPTTVYLNTVGTPVTATSAFSSDGAVGSPSPASVAPPSPGVCASPTSTFAPPAVVTASPVSERRQNRTQSKNANESRFDSLNRCNSVYATSTYAPKKVGGPGRSSAGSSSSASPAAPDSPVLSFKNGPTGERAAPQSSVVVTLATPAAAAVAAAAANGRATDKIKKALPPKYIELPSLIERLSDRRSSPNLDPAVIVAAAARAQTPQPSRPAGVDMEEEKSVVEFGVGPGGTIQFGSDDLRKRFLHSAQGVGPGGLPGPSVSPQEVRRFRETMQWPIKPIFPASPSGKQQEPSWPTVAAGPPRASLAATPVDASKLTRIVTTSSVESPLASPESSPEAVDDKPYGGFAFQAAANRLHRNVSRSVSRKWNGERRGSSFLSSLTSNTPHAVAAEPHGHTRTKKRRESVSAIRPQSVTPLSWTIEPSYAGNVGLQNAIHSAEEDSHEFYWIGCLNTSADMLLSDEKSRAVINAELMRKYNSVPVWVSDEEMEGHYQQFCKQVLWPTFHYVLPDRPRGPSFEQSTWRSYVAVNRKFADEIVETYRDGDIIWVHDYHLMLVPSMVREKLPDACIGFFLHIPFPSSEVFRCLHVRKQVLEGLLGADMIGFQTYPYARHFLQTCTRLLGHETSPKGIQLDNTFVSAQIFPVGIDTERLNEKKQSEEVLDMVASLKDKYHGVKLVIGRDKVDHIKGVRQKLLAFEQFLSLHPEWIGKVVMIQIALSTTEQNELQAQVSDVAARINSRFGTLNFQPVVYLQQDISFNQYLALLSVADVFVITSLRDGMNLTSHEYVVCQDRRHSPLVISEFTGTYGSFGAALRVNPWDYREVADAIHDALTMGEVEKRQRWKEMYRHVVTNTGKHWVNSYITELAKVHEDVQRRYSIHIPFLAPKAFVGSYAKARKRIFFLDYDGTLVLYERTPKNPVLPASSRLVSILRALVADPRNVVYIMSGRTKANLDETLGSVVPGLGLSGENGCFLKRPGNATWTALHEADFSVAQHTVWREKVAQIFDYYSERTPGSYIEQKDVAMVWHYRNVDNPTYGAWQASELQNHIEDSMGSVYLIHVLAGNKNLEVMPRNVNKSVAVRRVLEHEPDVEFILSIGDDRSDEDMFEFLNKYREEKPQKQVITCTVGSKSSKAGHFVTGVAGVITCLEQLLNGGEPTSRSAPTSTVSSPVMFHRE